MLIVSNATITWIEPGIFDDIEGGRVTHHGDTASFWSKTDRGNFTQVDRLTQVTHKEGDGGHTFTGTSWHLVNQVGVIEEDAIVNVRVKGDDDCPSC